MKTHLLFAIGAALALVAPPLDAQTSKTPDSQPAPAPQIEIESRFYTVSQSAAERLGLIRLRGDGEPAWHGKLSKSDSEKLIGLLVKEKSARMLSSPRVTTKSGQRAVVEVIREFRYATAFEPNKDGVLAPAKFETQNVGTMVEIEPTLSEGELIDLKVIPRRTGFHGFVGYAGGKTAASEPISKDGFTQPIFDNTEYSLNATLRSEQTLLLGGFPWMGSNDIVADPVAMALEEKPEADPSGEPKLMFVTLTARLIQPDLSAQRAAGEIQPDGPVEISAELVNVTRDQAAESDLLKGLIGPTGKVASIGGAAPTGTPASIVGVFDSKQVDIARKMLEKSSGGAFSAGPKKTIASGGQYSMDVTGPLYFPKQKDGDARHAMERLNLQLDVRASAQSENVIDLDILPSFSNFAPADADAAADPKTGESPMEWKERLSPAAPGNGHSGTTSVSIFNGSAVVLLRPTEGHADHFQILLITAKGTPSGPESEPKKEAAPVPEAGAGKLPSAIAVPGKPGFFISPFAPGMGMVDARGFPSGTKVKCPYSGKTFVIP